MLGYHKTEKINYSLIEKSGFGSPSYDFDFCLAELTDRDPLPITSERQEPMPELADLFNSERRVEIELTVRVIRMPPTDIRDRLAKGYG